jgi:general secretion pathway protein F
LIGISNVFINYWYVIFGLIFMSYLVFQNWRKSPTGAIQWDVLILKAPIIGPVVRMVAVSRFTRTLSTLLNGGVPMLYALQIVRNVVDNHVIAEAIDDAKNNISEG